MKKHYCVVKTENGLIESIIFSELSGRDLRKQNPNILTVVSSERVSHPSPELLVKAMRKLDYDVAKFYSVCYQIDAEDKASEQLDSDNNLKG